MMERVVNCVCVCDSELVYSLSHSYRADRIESIKEDQAFSLSYALAPPPTPTRPHFPVSKPDRRHTGKLN